MSINPPRETLESLRITVARLEQSTDPSTNPREAAELKRILLARIADLEVLAALEPIAGVRLPTDDSPINSVAALPPLEIVAAEEPAKEAAETTRPVDPASDLE